MRSCLFLTLALISCGGSAQSPDGGPDIPPGLIDPARVTSWNPGILRDDQLGLPLGDDGLPVRTAACATLDPGDDIQAAIDACPEGQVVALNASGDTSSRPIQPPPSRRCGTCAASRMFSRSRSMASGGESWQRLPQASPICASGSRLCWSAPSATCANCGARRHRWSICS